MEAVDRTKNTPDEQWKLVEEILHSPSFSKASRLSSFFSHICTHKLRGDSVKLNERQIGIEVFGRPETYNPGEDSIVRASARILRARLDHYFSSVDPHSKWIITMPRGSYVPSFDLRPPAAAFVEPTVTVPQPQPVSPSRRWAGVPLTASSLGLVVAALFGYWLSSRTHSASPVSEDHLWSMILTPSRRTVIVPGDSMLSLLQADRERVLPLAAYMNHDYEALTTSPESAPWSKLGRIFIHHQDTSIADLSMAFRVGRLYEARNSPLEIRYARDFTLGDLKSSNVIMLGGPRGNPWVQLFADRIDYALDNDPNIGADVATVRSPRNGEQAHYSADSTSVDTFGYGIVAFIPGTDSQGQVLLLEGTNTAGLQAVCDLVMDQTALSRFEKTVRRPDGHLSHFEMLVKARVIQGNSSAPEVLAYRTLP